MNSNASGTIKENIALVRGRIAAASERAGRDPARIKLVAVSKTKPANAVLEAYNEGLTAFGENYVQEFIAKMDSPELNGHTGVEWHMIGHIQTNKVRQIIGRTSLIHSLDSMRLAEEIQKQAEKAQTTVDALIEVNIAREENKHGFFIEEAPAAVGRIAAYGKIRVLGFMACAPLTDEPENNRTYFRQMNELYIDISHKTVDNTCMQILSMGMSGDFEVAIEEGSNMLRIGTLLFGGR